MTHLGLLQRQKMDRQVTVWHFVENNPQVADKGIAVYIE